MRTDTTTSTIGVNGMGFRGKLHTFSDAIYFGFTDNHYTTLQSAECFIRRLF